jgi:hypothetical protein
MCCVLWLPLFTLPFYSEVSTKAQNWLFELSIREVPTLLWALDGVLNRNGALRQQATYEIFSTVSRLMQLAVCMSAGWKVFWYSLLVYLLACVPVCVRVSFNGTFLA